MGCSSTSPLEWKSTEAYSNYRVVVPLSGGLDSATVLAKALQDGRSVFPVFFNYGQTHLRPELRAADALLAHYRTLAAHDEEIRVAQLRVVDLGNLGLGSSLLGDGKIPSAEEAPDTQISSTYVPCRNAIFFSIAAGIAESYGCGSVWLGLNRVDADGRPLPDGRVEFVKALELALFLGSKRGVESRKPISFKTPLIEMDKSRVLAHALELGVPVGLTRSCYADTDLPCGRCSACVTRAWAFAELRKTDPALNSPKRVVFR